MNPTNRVFAACHHLYPAESAGSPMRMATPRRHRFAAPFVWLFAALMLCCLAPANAIAQKAPATELFLGTVSLDGLPDVNFNMKFPATADGKTYYYLDNNNINGADDNGTNTNIRFNQMEMIVNADGAPIVDTQLDGHDGSDDARSVIMEDANGQPHTLVMPTLAEMKALRSMITTGTGIPENWNDPGDPTMSSDVPFWTSTTIPPIVIAHYFYSFSSETAVTTNDAFNTYNYAFQVIAPLSFGMDTVVDEQNYTVGTEHFLSLPEAGGGVAPLTYTLTPSTDIPAGLNFDADARTLAGTPTRVSDAAVLTYTVTDASSTATSLTFMVTVATIPEVDSVEGATGFYTEDDSVPITITFSEAVTVDITGGIPQLELASGHTDGARAAYSGGSGSALTFTYSVRAGDNTADLAYTGSDALILNGGAIQNAAASVDADLTLWAPGMPNSLSASSDVVLDNTVPEFVSGERSTVEIGAPITVIAYDADAIDNGGAEDVGITYSLGGTDASQFDLDTETGVVNYRNIQNNPVIHNIVITATDRVGLSITQDVAISTANFTVTALADENIAENMMYTSATPSTTWNLYRHTRLEPGRCRWR